MQIVPSLWSRQIHHSPRIIALCHVRLRIAARRRLFLWLVKQIGVDSRPRFCLVLVDSDLCSCELTRHTDSLGHYGHLVQNEFEYFSSLALDLPCVRCQAHLVTAGCCRQGRINVRIRNKDSSRLNHTDINSIQHAVILQYPWHFAQHRIVVPLSGLTGQLTTPLGMGTIAD